MPNNPNVGCAFASLRLTRTDLDPDEVTRRLGIVPMEAFRRGDTFSRGLVRKLGYWGISSQDQVATNDLEEHIAWLLDRLEPASGPFKALCAEDVDADIFCYLETRGQGGPEFSSRLMGRLAALGLPLGLDIYYYTGDDE